VHFKPRVFFYVSKDSIRSTREGFDACVYPFLAHRNAKGMESVETLRRQAAALEIYGIELL
jgi:hypothetical protein